MTKNIRDAAPFISKMRDIFLNETVMLQSLRRLSRVKLLPHVACVFWEQQAMTGMQLRRIEWIVKRLDPAPDFGTCVPSGVQPIVDDMDAAIRHEMSHYEREWRLLVIALQAKVHEIKTYTSAVALLAPLNDTLAVKPLLRENLIGKLRGKDQLIDLQLSHSCPRDHHAITYALKYDLPHSEEQLVPMDSW